MIDLLIQYRAIFTILLGFLVVTILVVGNNYGKISKGKTAGYGMLVMMVAFTLMYLMETGYI